jgi:hypothetical protein
MVRSRGITHGFPLENVKLIVLVAAIGATKSRKRQCVGIVPIGLNGVFSRLDVVIDEGDFFVLSITIKQIPLMVIDFFG